MKWRSVKRAVVEQIAKSFEVDGQLQPIGLRPHPKKPGTFLLVWGRHRLEAAKKLGWTALDAEIMDLNEEAAGAATIAENLFRANLSPAETVIALMSWNERYQRRHPDTMGGRAGGLAKAKQAKRQSAGEDPETTDGAEPEPVAAPSFARQAAEQTRVPLSTIKRLVTIGKNLTEEQLGVLAGHPNVKYEHIKAVNKLAPDLRQQAVTLVAAGLSPKEAIAQATLPPGTTMVMVGDPGELPREVTEMTDEEWLEHFCGEVLARLKHTAVFKRDALLYRAIRDHRHTFRKATKKAMAQSKVGLTGPFHYAVSRALNIDHPSRWSPCGPCGGTGQSGDRGRCGYCYGNAYTVPTAGGLR